MSRVIVNQAHCIATGGSFDNGLPFSLSMGCGTWGRNNFSDNMNYRHYLNITRVSRPIPERVPSEARDLRRVLRQVRPRMTIAATVRELIERQAAQRPDAVYAVAADGDGAHRATANSLPAAGASARCCSATVSRPATRCRW